MLRQATQRLRGLSQRVHAGRLPRQSPRAAHRAYSTEQNVVSSQFPDIEIPATSMSDFIWGRLEEWPDHTAIVCGITGRSYTYAQLRENCRKFASSLRRMGFQPGATMGVILPNCPDYPVVALGAVEAGLLVSTFNPVYTPDEMAKQLVNAKPSVLVTLPEKHRQVMEATRLAGERGYRTPVVVVVPSIECLDMPVGAVHYREMIDNNFDDCLTPFPVDTNSPVVLPYSSGTTGLPKGVLLSHRNLIANSLQMHTKPFSIVSNTSGSYQDSLPAILPFFHIYGLVVVLLSKLRVGAKIVTLPRFDPKTFLNALLNHPATVLYLAPPLVLFLASHPEVKPEHLQSLRFVMSGAAPLGELDALRFLERGPSAKFVQGYGMTETSPVTLLCKVDATKMASVGVSLPNTRVKIADMETGAALGPGKVGEVCIQGPQNMLGYHDNPEATAEMVDPAGWLHTGDLGYYDDDGDFFIVDRLKELIKVKGFQVAPAELEEILRSHPDVADAGVIGIPDSQTGEAPLAYVVPRPSARPEDLVRDVKAFVAAKVSSYKHLKEVRVVSSIAKNPSGKILRKELRAMYKEGS